MTISFPNNSRNYDSARRCVQFWGHESTFEIAFYLEETALLKFSRQTKMDEASSLLAFDRNRGQIQKAAQSAYERQRSSFYRLSATDF